MMKVKFQDIKLNLTITFIIGFTLFTFLLPQALQASTSGGATIYNTVKVTYTSGTQTAVASDDAITIVNTLAALPTVVNPTGQTVAPETGVTYNYTVKSNSNGVDIYTTSALTNTATGISAATGTSVTASVSLWGGIALGSGAGTITVPNGTTTGLSAGDTVQIGTNTYTVTSITAGTAASTNSTTGNLVAEVPATIALTPIGSSTPITAGSVAAGTQVGEYTTVVVALTAGDPATSGTDGTYSTTYKITTGSLPAALNMTTTAVITTVTSPLVTITKTADKTNVEPGGTITYTITITNTHIAAQVTEVSVNDPVPAYTTYVANSTRLNDITVAGDGATSPLIAGLAVDSNLSRGAGIAATGILPAQGVAIIKYQLKVMN